jgi:hypothetical protein
MAPPPGEIKVLLREFSLRSTRPASGLGVRGAVVQFARNTVLVCQMSRRDRTGAAQ